jgi:hypothetical protein
MEERLLIEDHELGIDFRLFLEWNEKYPKQSSQPILQKIHTIVNQKKGGDKNTIIQTHIPLINISCSRWWFAC